MNTKEEWTAGGRRDAWKRHKMQIYGAAGTGPHRLPRDTNLVYFLVDHVSAVGDHAKYESLHCALAQQTGPKV